MLFPIQHRPVHWVDGMKISRRHFVESDEWVNDALRDRAALGLHAYDFGLLPPYRGGQPSNQLEILERVTHQVEVRLRQCNAITAGGSRIDWQPTEYGRELVFTHTYEGGVDDDQPVPYYVLLKVDLFDRMPAGVPDPEETPPRHPYSEPRYQLLVLPASQMNPDDMGLNHLVVGQLFRRHGHFTVNDAYIPPCTAVVSHPALIRYYESFGSMLNEVQLNSFKILEKIAQRDHSGVLPRNIRVLCSQLLDFIARTYFDYRNMGYQQPPIYLVSCFSNLAHLFFTALHLHGAKEKEEVLTYFYEWRDVTPGNFEEVLTKTMDIAYSHYRIQEAMEQVRVFLEVLSALWRKLASLEFIGQRKENIVVAEQQLVRPAQARQTWTLLE
jgi:hypothetical protein